MSMSYTRYHSSIRANFLLGFLAFGLFAYSLSLYLFQPDTSPLTASLWKARQASASYGTESGATPVHIHAGVCTGLRPSHSRLGYRLRKNDVRCEGFFSSDVNAQLEIMSFLRSPLHFDLFHDRNLHVRIPLLPRNIEGKQVHIRAVALPIKTYYRMDAVGPPNSIFVWPVDAVLAEARLKASRLGVFGWIGSKENKIFVPLSVVPEIRRKEVSAVQLQFKVRTPVDLQSFAYRWQDVDGHLSKWLSYNSSPLHSGQVIPIQLPDDCTGLLKLSIAARPQNSTLWLKLNLRMLVPEETL